MGAGIAQLACLAGCETLLWDPQPPALERGAERLRAALAKAVERGRLSEQDATDAAARMRTVSTLEELGPCETVIEAAPERLELKRKLFARLESACGPDTILATNTSSLSVTAIAAEAERPGRIVGMHFFNPPTRMRLVEVVPGEETSENTVEGTVELAERMGRTAVRAADGPGFIANRCARPFFLESLRMLADGVGSHDEIDRAIRIGGGFRMGPFELIDLIGIDVNFGVARSFFKQSFGEPRWRPSPIQARMVAAGRLGRKSGRGFYTYAKGERHRPEDPALDAECPILDPRRLDEVAGPRAAQVLGRLSAQIVNEACFALAEGVGSAEDIDTAMALGYNWPIGPLEWGRQLGYAAVLGELEALREIRGEAYRPAPELRLLASG
ncbi:MAG: 3-hydroxybutyryl-CoA dehydrogenase [Solirubrobacterales bacterium]|nr:3-hydroxybutyryl-CoA dehydrogenase [Solirubrobacterales bacterium]